MKVRIDANKQIGSRFRRINNQIIIGEHCSTISKEHKPYNTGNRNDLYIGVPKLIGIGIRFEEIAKIYD